MSAVYSKELRSFFTNMTGYIFVAFMLLMTGVFVTAVNLNGRSPQIEASLSAVCIIFLLIIPILSMRSVAEERHQRTDSLLYSLPLTSGQIVLGKYFAMLTVLAIPTLVMCLYPLVFTLYGTVSLVSSYGSLLGFFCFGAALIAIGMFASSLTESQVIAAVLAFGAVLICYLIDALVTLIPHTAFASFLFFTAVIAAVGLLCYFMTKNLTFSIATAAVLEGAVFVVYIINASLFESLAHRVLLRISIYNRMNNFIDGIFDIGSLVYFLSVILLFLFFTNQSLEKRRWS